MSLATGSHSGTCQTGQCSIYLPRRDGTLSWPRWLVTYTGYIPRWFIRRRLRTVTLPSSNPAAHGRESHALTTTLSCQGMTLFRWPHTALCVLIDSPIYLFTYLFIDRPSNRSIMFRLCVTIAVCMLQQQYFSEYPGGINPVQLNDVIFSLHATATAIVTGLQCLIYDVSVWAFCYVTV